MTHTVVSLLYDDPVPDSYLLHAFVIENVYQAAASKEPKSGSLYVSFNIVYRVYSHFSHNIPC